MDDVKVEEREQIVTWLRASVAPANVPSDIAAPYANATAIVVNAIAAAIERGDHLPTRDGRAT